MPGGSGMFILFCTPFVYGATILCAPRIFTRWLRRGEEAWVWGLAMGLGFCIAIGVFFYFTGVLKSWPPRGEEHEALYWVPPILLVHAIACRIAWALFGIRQPR